MKHESKTILLQSLEDLLRTGVLTPATIVDLDTFVCLVEKSHNGINYAQAAFSELPSEWQNALKGRLRGDKVGSFKIVGVFDIWDVPQNETDRPKGLLSN